MTFLFRALISMIAANLVVAAGELPRAVPVPLTAAPEASPYPWITQLSAGPVSWSGTPDSEEAGYLHRAVVTTTEIYNDVIVERVTIGEEGFGKKLAWSRQMDVSAFAEGFAIRGEFSGLAVERWLDSDTFVVSMQGRRFSARVIAPDHLLVEEIGQPRVARDDAQVPTTELPISASCEQIAMAVKECGINPEITDNSSGCVVHAGAPTSTVVERIDPGTVIRTRLSENGWTEDLECAADGPGTSAFAFRKDGVLCRFALGAPSYIENGEIISAELFEIEAACSREMLEVEPRR